MDDSGWQLIMDAAPWQPRVAVAPSNRRDRALHGAKLPGLPRTGLQLPDAPPAAELPTCGRATKHASRAGGGMAAGWWGHLRLPLEKKAWLRQRCSRRGARGSIRARAVSLVSSVHEPSVHGPRPRSHRR
jgi:hypothetical protein